MPQYYHSETVSWSSKSKGKSHGRRNVVTIKNGRGTKTLSNLDKHGKPLKTKTRKLSAREAKNVLEGKFMPGFWKNCTVGTCARLGK